MIEAVFEEMGVKEKVFKTLDEVMKPGAILASNTSTLDVDKIAAFTKRPQDVVGMHFFSPANVMKLLEVVRGAKTGKDVLATVMGVAKKIKKTAVVSGVCDGFIGNRMIEQYSRQAGFLLDEGCTPAQVDKAIEKFGFAMGPFRMGDLAGNDIGWAIRKRRNVEKPGMRYSKTADLLCEMGRYGQKTQAGWYDYVAGKRDAIPSPLVVEMIEKHRAGLGIKPRKIGDDEIVHRLVYALVNEGAKILEEGIASKASDIDMVYLTGYGFPLHRGGPMCYADTVGPVQRGADDEALRRQPAGRRRVLAAGAAAGQAGGRRQELQLSPAILQGIIMTQALIVSTARTPLAKSWKGAFNMTHGATLGGLAVKAAVERAGVDPGRHRRRADGLRQPRRRHRHEHRAPGRACAPDCRSRWAASPSTASAPAACRPSPWRRNASSPARATCWSPAASRAFPACSRK